MLKGFFSLLLALVIIPAGVVAQDTLPRINVKNINSRIIISWKNTYGANISNISIQRSPDSLRNFTTIGSVLNPQNKENGFSDVKAPSSKMFYRVFVAFEGGSYVYTNSQRPVIDSSYKLIAKPADNQDVVKPSVGFVPSRQVFTNKENNVILNLPEALIKKYSVKFFDEAGIFIFEITKIKEPFLIVEKVNFRHAGWFFFELYESGELLEKHKFFIPKDGKSVQQGEQGKRGK